MSAALPVVPPLPALNVGKFYQDLERQRLAGPPANTAPKPAAPQRARSFAAIALEVYGACGAGEDSDLLPTTARGGLR